MRKQIRKLGPGGDEREGAYSERVTAKVVLLLRSVASPVGGLRTSPRHGRAGVVSGGSPGRASLQQQQRERHGRARRETCMMDTQQRRTEGAPASSPAAGL